MEMQTKKQYTTMPKTPDFIKSLFDEDSGLGMDFSAFENSPTISIFRSNDSSAFQDSPTINFLKSRDSVYCQDSPTISFLKLRGRNHCQDSPTVSVLVSENNSKRKRPETNETPVSLSKKRFIRSNGQKLLKKSLSFDMQLLGINGNRHKVDDAHINDESNSGDVLIEGRVLTGDGSKECCLPTVQGRFNDLRYITAATMTDVLNGKYDDILNSYRIIDSRYSYEFDGGHIKGAENIHNKDDILNFFNNPTSCSGEKRDILIFHCEFSSERGPKMCRHLRNHDREINAENYPALFYPEIYILKGGYKEFYAHFKTMCSPMNYVPMLSKDHKEDLRHFRSKSKSWYAGQKRIKSGRLF